MLTVTLVMFLTSLGSVLNNLGPLIAKLSSLLDEKNCLKLYILADFHLTPKLEKEALDVVADNLEAVFESEDWEDCIKNHPNLALKISRVAVKGTERKRRKNI